MNSVNCISKKKSIAVNGVKHVLIEIIVWVMAVKWMDLIGPDSANTNASL